MTLSDAFTTDRFFSLWTTVTMRLLVYTEDKFDMGPLDRDTVGFFRLMNIDWMKFKFVSCRLSKMVKHRAQLYTVYHIPCQQC